MSSEDGLVRLSEIADLTVGGIWGADEPTDDSSIGVYCLRGVDVDALARRAMATPPTRYISSSQLASRELHYGDIIIEASGSNCGRSIAASRVVASAFDLPLVYSNFCKRIRIRNLEAWDPLYVWRVIQSSYAVGDVQKFRTGSAVPNLDVKQLVARLNVPTRPIGEQRAIVEVLGSLEDAIENRLARHRGRITTLVNLATAPNRHGPISGGFALTIGGDWGADEPDDSHTEQVLCLRGKDLEGILAGAPDDIPVRYFKPASVQKRRLQPGDVLTAGSGTLGPSLLITESLLSGFSLPPVYTNFVKRIRANSTGVTPLGLFAALHGMWRTGSIEQFRTGTAMSNLDGKALVRNVETSPSSAAVPNSVVEGLLSFDDIAAIRTLQLTRDALLPKLVSGEIRIESPERLLDQVA